MQIQSAQNSLVTSRTRRNNSYAAVNAIRDRRSSLRAPILTSATCSIGDKLIELDIEDVSSTGLSCSGAANLDDVEKIRIYLPIRCVGQQIPDICKLQGRIVWRGRGRFGIKFYNLSSTSRAQLTAYVEDIMKLV